MLLLLFPGDETPFPAHPQGEAAPLPQALSLLHPAGEVAAARPLAHRRIRRADARRAQDPNAGSQCALRRPLVGERSVYITCVCVQLPCVGVPSLAHRPIHRRCIFTVPTLAVLKIPMQGANALYDDPWSVSLTVRARAWARARGKTRNRCYGKQGHDRRGPHPQRTHTEGRTPQRTHHRRGGPHRGPTPNTHRHSRLSFLRV